MNSKRWQDQFHEELKTLENTQSSIPAGMGELAYALEHQIIPEDVYFSWAQESHQLPLLKMAYFDNHSADMELWNKWQSHFSWSPQCLPLAEWEGHLLIACLEPQTFPESLPAISVLCPPFALKKVWSAYSNAAPLILKEETNSGESTPAENVEVTASPEGLAGSEESLAPVDLTKMDGLLNQPAAQVKLEKIEEPALPVEAAAEAAIPDAEEDAPLEPKPVKPIPPPPQTATAGPAKAIPATPSVKPANLAALAAAAKKETYLLEMIQKDKPQAFQTDCKHVFEEMKGYFSKSLLISTDSKGLFAKPIAWDENFAENKSATPVELKTPSIFRIVETTQKSYHGPISLNEVNERFFEDWNKNAIPGHVTIAPLISHDKVIGMLMGFAEPSAYNKNTLIATEKLATEFIEKLIPGKAKAA